MRPFKAAIDCPSKKGHFWEPAAVSISIVRISPITMKTIPLFTAVVLATTLFAAGATAQTANPTPPAATHAAPKAPAAEPAATIQPMQAPAPNQIIYIPQLPSPGALVAAATAQGVTVELINQTSTQITVVYRFSNGQTNTICYQLLSAAATAQAPAQMPAGATTVAVPPSTTVIYAPPGPAYYYDPFYYPWPWYAPVSVSLGFGFHGRDGYFHGGGGHFHGWH